MKKFLATKTGKFVLILVILLLLALGVFVWFFPRFMVPVLVTVLVIGLLWIGIELFLRSRRRGRQRKFDESVAAREGIEDRKREWSSWVTELEKQGIDRYALPFYLLVGEPQSGKSVLLQNSDLHFPFGQTRLSGVGGTRGCDWWFTEEAVILDLAGRLFTHEGGAADEMEWNAFLDMLVNFRPLCPANGVLLVVPCDGLLEDQREAAANKAHKIQKALLTLTNKLQAQLPVYFVLTKGDKVFGFAESVHRLDAPKRHEMFGWSRAADKAELPFDLNETRAGFEALVQRAQLLRAEMLSTARLPEAQPEVDRLYAFPEELRGVWSNLEVYLRNIFTESSLVDRVAFRGLYLTSGLQSGVPIAKVCTALLGESGQADARTLEGLFTKQRAYFIKDLVRNRVFGERGLVRPTAKRVVRAQRNAWIGYGLAAAIALCAVGGSVWYLATEKSEVETTVEHLALTSGDELHASATELPLVLDKLDWIVMAASSSATRVGDDMFATARPRFKALFAKLVDLKLVPLVRERAEIGLRERLRTPPVTLAEFEARVQDAGLLLSDIDTADAAALTRLRGMVPPEERAGAGLEARTSDADPQKLGIAGRPPLTLEDAFRLRDEWNSGEKAKSEPDGGGDRFSPALNEIVLAITEQWNGVLTPGSPSQPESDLGYVLAWSGVEENFAALNKPDLASQRDVHAAAERYNRSLDMLQKSEIGLEAASGKHNLYPNKAEAQLKRFETDRETFLRAASPGRPIATVWDRTVPLRGKLDTLKKSTSATTDPKKAAVNLISDLKGGAPVVVPTPELEKLCDKTLGEACKPALLPSEAWLLADWKLDSLASDIRTARTRFVEVDARSTASNVVRAKALEVGRQFKEHYGEWPVLESDPHAPPSSDARPFRVELCQTLITLRDELRSLDATAFAEWSMRVEALLQQYFSELHRQWTAASAPPNAKAIDWDAMKVLLSVSGQPGRTTTVSATLKTAASNVSSLYLKRFEQALSEEWNTRQPDGAETEKLFTALQGHLELLASNLGVAGLNDDVAHRDWLEEVDLLLLGRVGVHEKDLREYWKAPTVMSWAALTLEGAAAQACQLLSSEELKKKQSSVGDLGVPNIAALPKDDSPLLQDLPQTAKALAALRNINETRTAGRIANDPFVKGVSDFIGQFKSPELGGAISSKDGAALAGGLWQWRVARDASLKPTGSAGYFADGIRTSFEELLLRAIRGAYTESLRTDIIESHAAVIDAIKNLAPGKFDDKTLMQQAESLFNKGGRLDELRKKYKLVGCDKPLDDLRPKTPPADDERMWEMLDCLTALQGFLLGEKEKIADNELSMEIHPDATVAGSVWLVTEGRDTFFVQVLPAGDKVQKSIDGTIDSQTISLKWGLHTDNARVLLMRWSEDGLSWDPQETDWRLEFNGTFAPLFVAWSGTRDGKNWKINLTPKGSKSSAPLTLTFVGKSDLPVRPK